MNSGNQCEKGPNNRKRKKEKNQGHTLSGRQCHSQVENKNGSCKKPRERVFGKKKILSTLKAMNEIKETVFIAPDSHDYCGSAINM